MKFNRKEFLKGKILEHIKKAQELQKKEKNEIITQALAMHAFQAVNYAIDLMEEIIKDKGLGLPLTYGEMPSLLASHNLISSEDAKSIRRLIKYRNMIAHEYHILSDINLEQMINLLPSLLSLTQLVEK